MAQRGKSAPALAETVHLALVEALRAGSYRPGDRLREEEVAARLGVSRTPVREAFGRLVAKNLVEAAGGRGLVVRSLSTGEIVELYAMRELLEGAAAGLAAQNRVPAEIDALQDLHSRLGVPGQTPEELARLNAHFHAAIVRAARNRYLDQALSDLGDAIALLGVTTFSVQGRPEEAAREHEAILATIRSGAAKAAEEAARSHIRTALRSRLLLIDR